MSAFVKKSKKERREELAQELSYERYWNDMSPLSRMITEVQWCLWCNDQRSVMELLVKIAQQVTLEHEEALEANYEQEDKGLAEAQPTIDRD